MAEMPSRVAATVGRFAAHAGDGRLRKDVFGAISAPAAEIGHHVFGHLRSVEHGIEETAQAAGARRNRGRATECKAHASRSQVIGGLGKLAQQPFAGFRRQAIRNAHEGCLLRASFGEQTISRGSGTEENRAPAGLLGQGQEVQHARNMNAFAQGRGDDRFFELHCSPPIPGAEVSGAHDDWLLPRNPVLPAR
jgi:hypothetical protein